MAEETTPQGGDEDNVEVEELTPEQIAAAQKDKRLAEENAKARLANKALRAELNEVKAKIADLDQIKADFAAQKEEREAELAKKGHGKTEENPEVVRLRREMAEKDKKAEERIQQLEAGLQTKAHKNAIAQMVAEAGLLEPGSAAELLERKTKWDPETESIIAVVKDEDGEPAEQAIKGKDSLKKAALLPGIFWPAEGVPGAGSRAPGGVAGRGFDLEKAMSSQSAFEKDRDKVRAEMRKQRAGG